MPIRQIVHPGGRPSERPGAFPEAGRVIARQAFSSAVAPAPDRDGWTVLHLFARVTASLDPQAVLTALKRAGELGDQVVTGAVLGHKADLAVMAIGSDPWRLRDLQSALQRAGLEMAASYVSLTELSDVASESSPTPR